MQTQTNLQVPHLTSPSNQTIPDVFSLSLPTVKQILKRRLNWNQSRTDSRAIVGSPGLQPREEPRVSSRAAAAARPKPGVGSRYPQQVFAGGPELCELSLVPRPLRSAACSKEVCLQESHGEPIHIFKGLASCSPELLLRRVESAPALRKVM